MKQETARQNYLFLSALAEALAEQPDGDLRDLITRARAQAARKLEQSRREAGDEEYGED